MKLLGWIYNCLTGQCYPKPDNKSSTKSQFQRDNSFPGLVEEGGGEESSVALSDIFHGFLAIGTLGIHPLVSDPSTPTFSFSVENNNVAEEDELKLLINDEVEKVLQVSEACKDDEMMMMSGRNSCVSSTGTGTGRSSHCSTITIGGKPIENAATGTNNIICPLQGYLFGSAIHSHKEHRPSLGQLFQKTKLTDETKVYRGEKRADKEADKSAVHLMKKILKKGMLHASSSSTAASGETKLNKILHIFHRKVHPDGSTTATKTGKPTKNEIKDTQMYNPGGFPVTSEDVTTIPKSTTRLKSQSHIQRFTIGTDYSNGNRECWIKTDADYLVLEL